ncbi:lysophospholipid acyltransferase family protein [Reinekea blandensis]|nr:lysophospholipid acyltransferase family protein [Reinekea blandensis]
MVYAFIMLLENWPKSVRVILFRILGLTWILNLLAHMQKDHPSTHELLNRIFNRNQFDVRVFNEERLPKEGGCVIAINHPHGFFDGLGAVWLGSKHGNDCRIIGRHFISVFKPIRRLFLFIKIDAERRSDQGAQITEQSSEFVRNGGRLGISSAGRLSLSNPVWKPAEDLPWKTGTVRIATAAEAPIVLVYVDVRHSTWRQIGQRIHPVVRALAQVWSYRFFRTQKLHMHILDVVHPDQLPQGDVREQTQWLQAHFDKLSADISTGRQRRTT